MKFYGKALKVILVARDIPSYRFAQALNISDCYLSLIIHGKKEPTPKFVKKISRILKIKPERLLIEEEAPK